MIVRTIPSIEQLKLCDLLIGRMFRARAIDALALALHPQPVPGAFETAVQQEWLAQEAEHGKIRWGARFNRNGGWAPRMDSPYIALMTWDEFLWGRLGPRNSAAR